MTNRQKLFAEHYLANGYNALNAYYEAFPGSKDKPGKPAYPYTLLKNPEVAEYIEKRRKEIYDSLNVDAMRVAQELATIAFCEKGDEVYTVNAKLKALELLSKNLGLQTQKTENKDIIEVSLVGEE